MEWILWLVIGFVAGVGAAAAWVLAKRAGAQAEVANLRARAELLDQQCRQQLAEIGRVANEIKAVDQKRETAERQAAVLTEQKRVLEEAEKKLTETFKATGVEALRANSEQFLALAKKQFEVLLSDAKGDVEKKQQAIDNLVEPIRELLEKQNTAIKEIEGKRETAYVRLDEQIKHIAKSHQLLSTETSRLVSALRRSDVRGRWGENALRNAVEFAGMIEHCDFDEQVSIWVGDHMRRPDMVVKLPGRGVIPVDAKVALDAYEQATRCDGDERKACLVRHAEQVERHVQELANRRYWDGFDQAHAPKLVVMFMPLESALIAALEIKPELQTQAMQQHVLIATPTLLVALLRAVAYGWQQDALAANARDIANCGAELYSRIQKFVKDLERVGKNLAQASGAYNSAIGSLEARVMPGARKLRELHVSSDGEIETPELVDIEVRPIVSAELKTLPSSSELFSVDDKA